MATHSFVLLLRVTAKHYADAARLFRDGNKKANPFALALIERGTYKLSRNTAKRIMLIDIATGRHYSDSVLAVLANYLAGFRRGRRILEDHEFEVVLESDRD